jgi:ubiquinone/menaquinone biosynthesis C-methylase UbiE
MEHSPHSAQFLQSAERDYWWNLDHIELWARRVGLDDVGSVLDVGSGVGHWSRLLSHVLPADATLVGIDREPRWVEEATAHAAQAGLDDRFSYRLAFAEELPFEDGSFDLVTCQTVLIHVADPRRVIGEMLRVTKPGGLVVASEPNNRALTLMVTSVSVKDALDERVDLVRFYITCEEGKAALGEGNNSVGDLVPGYFNESGLEDIQVCQSDKVSLMIPPYEDPSQQALKEAYLLDAKEGGGWGWSKDEARRYFEAGGGDVAEFDGMWQRRLDEARRLAAAIEDGHFHAAGGDVLYLVSGRKRIG